MQLKEIPEVKNKVLLAAVLVACFIPSAVAYSSYKNAQRAPIDENTAVKISITDVNDKSYTLSRSKDAEAEDMIKYFLSLRSGAQSIVALPDSLLGVSRSRSRSLLRSGRTLENTISPPTPTRAT